MTIPGGLSEAARLALVRNIGMLYQGEPRGHPLQERFVICTYGQWELEIETKLRTGVEYEGRLSIHCFSPENNRRAQSNIIRRTHHWH